MGSIIALSNPAGETAETYKHDVFGSFKIYNALGKSPLPVLWVIRISLSLADTTPKPACTTIAQECIIHLSADSCSPTRLMTITLSVDHRVIDGVLAAQFLKRLKELLENPEQLVSQ